MSKARRLSGVDVLHTLAGELEQIKDGTVPRGNPHGMPPSREVREWAKGWLIHLVLLGAEPKRGQQ